MNKFNSQVFQEIAVALSTHIHQWCGTNASFDQNQIPEVRTFGHSFIARYLVSGGPAQAVLVKIAHRANQSDLQAALEDEFLRKLTRAEMSQLQATWDAFQKLGDPNLTAIQPLEYLDQWNAIVMLEVNAKSLRSQLVSPKIGFSQPEATTQFIQHLRKASQWLRYYHENVGHGKIMPASKTLMKERLEKISQDVANHLGTRFAAQENLAALKAQIETMDGMELIAQQHGDFHCSNILFTPQNQICILDPRAESNQMSVYIDLATLIVDLYLKPIPMFTGGFFTRRFLDQSQHAIVENYFKPGEFSQPLLNFYCACEVMFKWSMDERDFVRRKNLRRLAPLIRIFHTSYMRRLVKHFISQPG